VLYHKSMQLPVSLVVVHRGMAPELWYLVTNEPGTRAIEAAYRRRWWIEEHFRDLKSGQGLSVLSLGYEVIYALMLGPLPLSLLDRPLPLAVENTP